MDANTGLVVLGTALGTKDLVIKLLGPTADYVGEGLRYWTENRVKNVARIFGKAAQRLGDNIDLPGCSVPPRVLKGILEDGSFCEDELAADYFGGVLASSRTATSRDDRGASMVALLSRLTTYQIRSHFLFYSIVKSVFNGTDLNVLKPDGREAMLTFVSRDCYVAGMDFSENENVEIVLNHVLFGLSRESLIEPYFRSGSGTHIEGYSRQTDPGLSFSPASLGVELFHWAHGMGDLHVAHFLNSENQFTSTTQIDIRSTYRAASQLERILPAIAD